MKILLKRGLKKYLNKWIRYSELVVAIFLACIHPFLASMHLSLLPCIHLSLLPSIFPCFHPSFLASIHLSLLPSIHPSFLPSIHPSIFSCMKIHLSLLDCSNFSSFHLSFLPSILPPSFHPFFHLSFTSLPSFLNLLSSFRLSIRHHSSTTTLLVLRIKMACSRWKNSEKAPSVIRGLCKPWQ